jgi:hypothetical protein
MSSLGRNASPTATKGRCIEAAIGWVYLRCTARKCRSSCPASLGGVQRGLRENLKRLAVEKDLAFMGSYLSCGMVRREGTLETTSSAREATIPSLETSSLKVTHSGASRPATAKAKKNSRKQRARGLRLLWLSFIMHSLASCSSPMPYRIYEPGCENVPWPLDAERGPTVSGEPSFSRGTRPGGGGRAIRLPNHWN